MGRKAFVRQRILEAAFDLIAREGFEAVSTRDIARAAKVGPASMFKHFATKEELARELYRLALAPVLVGFAGLSAEASSSRDAVRGAVRQLYALYDDRPRALALLIFPPHEITPWEIDRANPVSARAVLQRLIGGDEDLAAIVWGAMTGPLQDRYLNRRKGTMAPVAEAHAARIAALIPRSSGAAT